VSEHPKNCLRCEALVRAREHRVAENQDMRRNCRRKPVHPVHSIWHGGIVYLCEYHYNRRMAAEKVIAEL
jgi:hypothetical protein